MFEDIRDLGVIFDQILNLRSHVNSICKSSFLALRNIRGVRKCLLRDQLERLIHALISSRIHYCNSLLYGLPSCHIDKVQTIQNTAPPFLAGAKPRESITPIEKHLHWVLVIKRCEFKILLIKYKKLHIMAPSYVINLWR